MKEYFKSIFMGLSIMVIGFIICSTLAGVFDGGNPDNSFLSAITFAILFLCSTLAVCTRAVLKTINKNTK